MAEGYEIHNHSSGRTRNGAQIGVNHGNIWMTSPSGPLSVDSTHAKRLQSLADAVRSASAGELERWGLRDRDALPVRWHAAADDLCDYWEKIQSDGTPASLEGDFTAIRRTYESLETRRLVVLGRAGAGKTVLAHRLILDLLNNNPTGPVPVLFSLGDWNPATELRLWLAEHLTRDYPFLDAPEPTTGKKQAKVLIERGLIVPVLDGFDEIPTQHHAAAIRQISALDLPLIVTSRPEEYACAAHEIKAVGGAAAIEIEDLTLREAEEYLLLSTGKTRAPAWSSVFEQLRSAPDEAASRNLAAVLTTPLMIMLARTVYNDEHGQNPRELLDSGRFAQVEDLEHHFLAAYLNTVYARRGTDPGGDRRPNWSSDQARRWLSHLATHLQLRNTSDITWWNFPATLHRRTRIFVTTTAVGVAGGLASAIASGLGLAFTDGSFRPHVVVYLLTLGLAAGLALGLINEWEFSRGRTGREPERLRLGLPHRDGEPRSPFAYLKRPTFEFASGLAVGVTCGFGYLLAAAIVVGIRGGGFTDQSAIALAFGLMFSLTFGLSNLLLSIFGDASDLLTTDPWTLLRLDRNTTLARTITAVVLASSLTAFVGIGPSDVALLLNLGSLIGIARWGFSGWASWLLFARLWLPLTRRLSWRPKSFLEDAYERGVLRRTGSVYQFRHARLRDHLANQHRSSSRQPHPCG